MTQQKTKQLPKEWNKEELGEVAEFKRGPFGSSVQKSVCVSRAKNTYKLYEQGNVINNDFERGKYYLSKEKFNELKNFEIESGDILITCAGTIGKIAIVPEKFEKGIINSVLMRIRIDKRKINRDYFLYFFKSSNVQNDIQSKSAGVAVKNLFATKLLKRFQIPLPPLPLQHLIVSTVETQFTRLDEAVKSLKTVKQKIEVYRKAVLKKAFEEKEGWEDILVKDMGKIVTGKTPKTSVLEYYGNDFCFFKPGDLGKGYLVNNSKFKLSKKGLETLKKLPEKSVMITCIGATIGKTGLSRVEGATNQQINSIIVNKNKFVPEILYYLFISEIGQRKIIDNSSSTTLPILNKGRFEKLKFVLPTSLLLQQQIVSHIESKFSVIDKVGEIVDNSLKKAERLRKSILKVAFEGRLVKNV